MCHRRRSLRRRGRCTGKVSIAIQSRAIYAAMAVHAPSHAQVLDLADALHGLDWTVTLLACDSSVYMRAMVEIDEVRQVVNLDPGNRGGRFGRIGLHLFVERQRVVDFL